MKTIRGKGKISYRGAEIAIGRYEWLLMPEGQASGRLTILDGERYLEAGETYTLQMEDGRSCDFFFTHTVNFNGYTITPHRSADLL